MEKADLLSHVGSMQQVAFVRPIRYSEGRAGGMSAYQVKNGPLSFTAMADKCLDVSELSYKGVSLAFLSKGGLTGPAHYDTHGQEALRSIMGGLFFTAGFENVCAPCEIEGKDYPMHGRLRTTPAEHCCGDAAWEEDGYWLTVRGAFREAELFGENLVLRRTLRTRYGDKTILLRDEMENEGFREEPALLLYHINFGYPLLEAGTRVILPARKTTPRDEISAKRLDGWSVMDAPKPNEPEYVFFHELGADAAGRSCAAVVNDRLGLGVALEFDQKHLPWFMEWKSTAAGDYVLGLEPANTAAFGRVWQEEHGGIHTLPPLAKETVELSITVLDGPEEISAFERRVAEIKTGKVETI